MHGRYYTAGVGRFLSPDPVWGSADLGKPLSWNRYAYVRDNPVNRTDPTGRVDGDVINFSFGVVSAFATDMWFGYGRPEPTSGAMAAGQVAGDVVAVAAGAQEIISGSTVTATGTIATVGTGGAGSPGTAPVAVAGAVVAAHGATTVAIASANLGRAAGAQMSSVNQMNKEVKGWASALRSEARRQRKIKGEQDHVHFNDKSQSVVNRDGTWKHGFAELKKATLDWLEQHGWTLPSA
jgi:hypothetical protein